MLKIVDIEQCERWSQVWVNILLYKLSKNVDIEKILADGQRWMDWHGWINTTNHNYHQYNKFRLPEGTNLGGGGRERGGAWVPRRMLRTHKCSPPRPAGEQWPNWLPSKSVWAPPTRCHPPTHYIVCWATGGDLVLAQNDYNLKSTNKFFFDLITPDGGLMYEKCKYFRNSRYTNEIGLVYRKKWCSA